MKNTLVYQNTTHMDAYVFDVATVEGPKSTLLGL